MSTLFKHTELGEIKGNVVDSTVQFLGLKYASLKDRLAPPQLVTSYGAGTIDASKHGYVCRIHVVF
jgi:carboxylesterase type B